MGDFVGCLSTLAKRMTPNKVFLIMELLAQKKMTSLELVEQINIFRKEDGKSELGHNDLLKVIRDEFEEEISLGIISQSDYRNERGQTYPKFDLTTSQAKQVLVRESKLVRKSVIAYIEKLESKLIEVSKKESLLIQLFSNNPLEVSLAHKELLALETAPLIEKIEQQAPKVEFYDQVADTTTSFDMQEVAGMLKLSYGRNILFRKLRNAKVLMNDNLPYRNLLDDGKFIVVETKWMNPKTEQTTATTQTRITQKGLDWLQKNKDKLGL